jgi:phosphohistidine phosphatase
MLCYLVRHAQAEDAGTWPGADADRPLTEKGRARMERAAKALAALDLGIDALVTSPLLRAKQTAAIVAKRLGHATRLREDARLADGFGLALLHAILVEHGDASAVMLVGHEPSMSRLVAELAGGAAVAFKPGTVACIDLPRPNSVQGTLIWFAPAKVLAALA